MEKFYIIVNKDTGAFVVCLSISSLVQMFSSWNTNDHTHIYMVDLRPTRMVVEEIPRREM